MNAITILPKVLVSFKTNYLNKNTYAKFSYNSLSLEILFVLYKDGLIDSYKINRSTNKVEVKLKYFKNKPLIKDLFLLSKPSHKKYLNAHSLRSLKHKYDYYCISTSKGLLSSRNLQSNNQIGGQLLFGIKLNYA